MVALAVDPIEAGFIDSLSRPGGNLTGSLSLGPVLNEKRLEVLREVAPHARRIGEMLNPQIWSIQGLRSAATALGIDLVPVEIRRHP
jgi:putative ABC transport system substrate-binding protein